MIKMTFIVTCYNEEKNVINAVNKVHEAAARLELTHEILVFDDASQDATAKIVEAFIQEYPTVPVKLHKNISNRGVAHNFVEGAFQGSGEYCRLVCGDDVESVDAHMTLLKEIGQADVIIPYYTKIFGRSTVRHAISFLFTKIINLISGFSLKYYNGCPILRRNDVLRWHVEATGLGYQAEFIIRLLRQGRTYKEIAIDGFDREGSVSLRLRNVLSVGHSIFKISISRLKVSILK